MSVRVDNEGYVIDSGRGPIIGPYNKPGQLHQEYLASAALKVATIPRDRIAALRPPVPQQVMPPRFGYNDTPITIEDILNIDRWTPLRRSWVSGSTVEMARTHLIEDQWSGTQRNASSAINPLG